MYAIIIIIVGGIPTLSVLLRAYCNISKSRIFIAGIVCASVLSV